MVKYCSLVHSKAVKGYIQIYLPTHRYNTKDPLSSRHISYMGKPPCPAFFFLPSDSFLAFCLLGRLSESFFI